MLILHVQIEINFPYPVGRRASDYFFKYKLWTNNLFCLKNNVIVSSRKQRSLHATQNSRQNLVENLPPLRNLLGTLSKDDDDGSKNVGKKNEFAFFQT